jgi:hypothetical protein
MQHLYPGQPVINSYHFIRTPTGHWVSTSWWSVAGRFSAASLTGIERLMLPGIGWVGLSAPTEARDAVVAQLQTAQGECASPLEQLVSAAEAVAAVLRLPITEEGQLPSVRLIVTPPAQGHAGFEVEVGTTLAATTLHMATQLPDSRACLWARHWAIETLDTLYHELFHAWRFSIHGWPADSLREETVAYAWGDCVARLADPQERPRERTFPGLQEHPVADIVQAARSGRIPATIAGRYLAYLSGPANGAAGVQNWKHLCAALPTAYPDLPATR